MQPTTVSTSLVHPATTYRLDVDGAGYVFGHPVYWARTGTRTDVGMDAYNRWGLDTDAAKGVFWEFVAEAVVWPSASVIAKEIIEGARLAGIAKAKKDAGHLELFDT